MLTNLQQFDLIQIVDQVDFIYKVMKLTLTWIVREQVLHVDVGLSSSLQLAVLVFLRLLWNGDTILVELLLLVIFVVAILRIKSQVLSLLGDEGIGSHVVDDVSHDVLLVGVLRSSELGLGGLGRHVGSRFSHNSNIIYNS